MVKRNFNRKECVKALYKLGFIRQNKRRGKHCKFIPPESIRKNTSDSSPPFIMIPRSRKLHCQREILTELKKMGGDELRDKFLKLL